MDIISSLQNPRIKELVKLAKNNYRREQQVVVIEGARELSLALSANYQVIEVFLCEELFHHTSYPNVLDSIAEDKITRISLLVFEKIAYRKSSDGLVAIAKEKPHNLDQLKLPNNPFLIVLEAIEKPGNLGAILRTADAAKVDAVIVCDPNTDIYNPNAIRSSVGCIFTIAIATCSSKDAVDFLAQKAIKTHAAELQAANWYHESDFTQASAIVMGTEDNGLSSYWLENANARIKIPMRGQIDSLNVSVSTAIISFEAMRQRDFR